ncbi:hypothetical protein K457DRAFT_459571 [Linnemannia elongata AG-77]|uniref:Uncharacterized protein n=1 Tax=Linnemannia elongata AG-77 TaxID=1314771 RepID=A0A197JXX4_9FUNG|nr:hypothetical protein K457DRAFT_459571 [Linnemannia elongata AG-77]
MVLQERKPKPVLYLTLCINALVFLFLSLLEQPFHTPMPSYRWASGRCLPLSCLLMWCFQKRLGHMIRALMQGVRSDICAFFRLNEDPATSPLPLVFLSNHFAPPSSVS